MLSMLLVRGLHTTTSFKLYQSLCLPVLLYGAEPFISMPSRSEVTMMERAHRKILRTIQRLPVRCKATSLCLLMGSLSVSDPITHRKLSFIISLVNLSDESLAKQVLLARLTSAGGRSLITCYRNILLDSSLPDLDFLLLQPFKPSVWKSSTRKQLFIHSFLHFLDDCKDYLVSDCEFKQGHPVKQWSVTIGDPKLTRLNPFRVRLVVGCACLEKDAARF